MKTGKITDQNGTTTIVEVYLIELPLETCVMLRGSYPESMKDKIGSSIFDAAQSVTLKE